MVKPMVEKSPNALMDFDAAAQILDFGDGEVGVVDAEAAGALADIDEAVLVAIDERAQEHAADQAEDGGVGADAEREREDYGDRQPFGSGQGARWRISGRSGNSQWRRRSAGVKALRS